MGFDNSPVKTDVTPEQLAEAIESEAQLAAECAEIRDAAKSFPGTLIRKLFLQLEPKMKTPIPEGFLIAVSKGKGKPYDSKGVRALQVQVNRMDAVWTPLFWDWRTEWIAPSLAEVTVWVGESEEKALVTRKARGGMNGGSTVGNHFKGTETNAGKLAFARIGPGNEVYLGATDFDPDTDEVAAEEQAHASSGKLPAEKVEALQQAVSAAGLGEHLPMKLRGYGVGKLEDLTVEQAFDIHAWAKAEAEGEG